MTRVLHELSSHSLRSLAASLREGTLSCGITRHPLEQIAGTRAAEVETCLHKMSASGMTPFHIALLVDTLVEAKAATREPSELIDLVLSGPDVPGIPTADTTGVMRSLIEEATSEVLLIGYAVHQGKRLFERLGAKMDERPELRACLYLDIARKQTDASLSQEIVRRFAKDFKENHWPGKRLPELFYDPRSLSESRSKRSSLHAKCVVVDRKIALILPRISRRLPSNGTSKPE